MSDPLGNYAFLGWMRRGAATQITRVDGAPGNEPRATFPVTLGFNADALTATAKLELYGPGEIGTFEARNVIRTWPRVDDFDAEANFFPQVELDEPDLAWRYTPATANAQSRLRPWIVLAVMTADEIESYQPPSRSRRLPVLKVKDAASLPNLAQSWAWAHVQVSGRRSVTPDEAATLLRNEPHAVLSRLLCPRQLGPKRAYRAFIVPAFERGRRAGLGESADGVDALAPAWLAGAASIELPVYYEWAFQTGAFGDFEYLVRLLKARPMPDTVGVRPMDVRTPDPMLPPAQSTPMLLEGALKSPAVPDRTWNAAERAAFVPELRKLLNRPAELLAAGGPKTVAPPLYGRWHAARDKTASARGPAWFVEQNDDPRDRVAGGLGTLVVQDEQEKLMASAWQQVDRIREINEAMRLAQLARESAARAHLRHIGTAAHESLLMLAAPVLNRIKGSPQTLAKLIDDSPIGRDVFEAQFRRIARPRGPVGRRQGRTRPSAAAGTLLERMNAGKLSAAPAPEAPASMTTLTRVPGLAPAWFTDAWRRFLLWLIAALPILGFLLLALALVLFVAGAGIAIAAVVLIVAVAAFVGRSALRRWLARLDREHGLANGTLAPNDIETAPPRPDFTLVPEVGPGAPPPPPSSSSTGGTDSAAAAEFRVAVAGVFADLRAPREPGKVLRPIDISAVRKKIEVAIDPATTIAAAMRSRLQISPFIGWRYQEQDPLEPIMAAPEFEQPMYEPLRDRSPDWLLPGLDQVPANTISLVKTNQPFIEAYMLGLNHEMGRELLWREYPTDQRGTYFRQFWDVRGYVGTADRESLRDIKRLPWPSDNALGANSPRPPLPGNQEHLVLLIRGDLLRRYPNIIVYAVKARRVGSRRELTQPEETRHYVFSGTMPPDVAFYGFEITKEEALGKPGDSPDQGWFFVLQEQPAEPRFGFDAATYPTAAATKWNDLNWAHFAADATALAQIKHVDLDAALPDTSAVVTEAGEPGVVWHADAGTGPRGAHASDTAYITLQRPVRIAVHGTDMLP